ncbi:PulJ/GspJ family protein [Shewanella frigidimarina]|uniref:PulJ/GspJ family protein n=1 Tax=Shewanella frigidimarina TaxID=56812 RepID=UPI003D7A6C01
MKKHNKLLSISSSGFTLVELLISMTILSMIMLLGSWSFSLFTSNWEGRLGHFSKNVSQTKDYMLLSDIISSTVPYIYRVNKKPSYYFKSTPTELLGVSQSAIFHPNSTIAYKFSVETFSDGSQYLLYQEAALGVVADGQQINYTHEKILITNAQSISFKVYGWETFAQKLKHDDIDNPSPEKPQWRERYDSQLSAYMPLSVAISWDDAVVQFPIVNDQGTGLTQLSPSNN